MGVDRPATETGAHSDAVAAVTAQYRRIPPSEPVRLAKRTSNLFRFRRDATTPGLDVSALDDVIMVDPETRTAEVQGMCTYERLVDRTLRYGLMPKVVPQLKTITLGGAVAGLGIESSSFRNGLPHESVVEMDILTGDGSIVTARDDNEHAELFRGFPNSYGCLGYAVRLVIELDEVEPYVRLRHLRFDSPAQAAEAMRRVCDEPVREGRRVDFLDGTVFGESSVYLTLGNFEAAAPRTSDYTGNRIYYRSIRRDAVDHLSVRDYLWRWDTDWFWCSRALGAQHPLVRPLWPRRFLRSDVYRRIVALDRRFGVTDRVDRMRGTRHEPVIQDVEIPIDRLAEFLEFFEREIGISPVWLCPVRLRDTTGWPLYPMDPRTLYVNVGFWSAVALRPGADPSSHNRAIEDKVTELDGHKSLYSTSFYTPDEFWRLYNQPAYLRLKRRYDPQGRLPGLYEKCVLER